VQLRQEIRDYDDAIQAAMDAALYIPEEFVGPTATAPAAGGAAAGARPGAGAEQVTTDDGGTTAATSKTAATKAAATAAAAATTATTAATTAAPASPSSANPADLMTTKELRQAVAVGSGRRRSPCQSTHCEPASSPVPLVSPLRHVLLPGRRWQRGKRRCTLPAPAAPGPGPAAPAAPLVS